MDFVEFEEFNFQPVNKSNSGGGHAKLPDNLIRVASKSMSFASNVASHWNDTRYRTEAEQLVTARINIEYDPNMKALRVTESADGFAVRIYEGGSAYMNKPKNVIRAGVEAGDYVLVEGTRNIYKLVQ